jgi:predicted component of type VI protein secretion system
MSTARCNRRLLVCPLVVAVLVLSGCGFKRTPVAYPPAAVTPASEQPRRIAVTVVASPGANVGDDSQSLPVKACLILTSGGSWKPPRASDGLPCTDVVRGEGVIDFQVSILPPGQAMHHVLDLPADGQAQLIAGAEFIQAGSRPWRTLALPASGDGDIVVLLDGRSVHVPDWVTP